LIDATTGHHLWTEQYDRVLEDFFAVQDEITLAIVSSLQVKLTDGEQARLRQRSTDNLKAWGLAVIRIFLLLFGTTREGHSLGQEAY
jgi:adenylate cyclase